MFAYVRASGWGTSAFFITWVILSNIILQQLFLAVIMEAFESKYDTEVRRRATRGEIERETRHTHRWHDRGCRHFHNTRR